jgi:hypothetical protein
VNAIDGGHEGYLISSRLASPVDSKEAAAATAAYRVLVTLFPGQKTTLDAQYAASLAGVPDGVPKARGIAVGEAARRSDDRGTNDGRCGPFRHPVGSGPGMWKPVLPEFVNDPSAWLKEVKPFLIRSGTQFRGQGPLELTSKECAREFNEVKVARLGWEHRTDRRPDPSRALLGGNPSATWSRVFRMLSGSRACRWSTTRACSRCST